MSLRTQRRALRFITVLTRYVGIGGLVLQLAWWMATKESNAGFVAAFLTLTGASVGADLIRDLREEMGKVDPLDESPPEDKKE